MVKTLKKWRKRLNLPLDKTQEELELEKRLQEGITFEELTELIKERRCMP